jgi:hypothetical protein
MNSIITTFYNSSTCCTIKGDPPPNPNPPAEAAPFEPKIGIFLISSYYANCVCDAKTVNVAAPVLIAVYV